MFGRSALLAVVLLINLPFAAPLRADPKTSGTFRIATYNVELSRKGPGLLLGDFLKGDDPQIEAVVAVIAKGAPDVLHLTGFDMDEEQHALRALRDALTNAGAHYPHVFAPMPNAGMPSGEDLDGNGRLGEARDSQGYGAFSGQGGMAILSKYPIKSAHNYSSFLWRDLVDNIAPGTPDHPFPSFAARAIQRLSSVGHWAVPIQLAPDKQITILAWHASPPVFDGEEDLNGRRSHDEALFWLRLLDGQTPFEPPKGPFVLTGLANIDPTDGDGRHEAINALLHDPRFQDPGPLSAGGLEAANTTHQGNPALDTADFTDPTPGNLRVDYVLPDAALAVRDAGVFWPARGHPMSEVAARASRHRLVWVDVTLP
ncbi:MAG: endonuclease/exonuclease/phosphatase family protein [Maritimibacter sp.]